MSNLAYPPFVFPKSKMYTLRNGRIAHEYGPAFTINGKGERSRRDGYTTVIIPLTKLELRNSRKKCHFQVVHNSRLREIKDNSLTLRSKFEAAMRGDM